MKLTGQILLAALSVASTVAVIAIGTYFGTMHALKKAAAASDGAAPQQ